MPQPRSTGRLLRMAPAGSTRLLTLRRRAIYGSTGCIESIDDFVGRGHEWLGSIDAAERRLAGLTDLVAESPR